MNPTEAIETFFQQNYKNHETTVFRDLSLNLKKILEDSPLEPAERYMNFLAIATALHNKEMMALARLVLTDLGTALEHMQECAEVAGIMGMNNTYYKFRSFLGGEVVQDYARAGLRMNSLMKPVTGKLNFETMSFAVSVVNGCATCVSTHERAVRELGMTADKIHDVARLAAVCKGLDSLKVAQA